MIFEWEDVELRHVCITTYVDALSRLAKTHQLHAARACGILVESSPPLPLPLLAGRICARKRHAYARAVRFVE